MSYTYREAALNWLALGLLLAAWNASDDADAAHDSPAGTDQALRASRAPPPRPAALRGYALVSVRAATNAALINRGFTSSK